MKKPIGEDPFPFLGRHNLFAQIANETAKSVKSDDKKTDKQHKKKGRPKKTA